MKDFADKIIDGIVYGDDKDKIPPNQHWGEVEEDDGENVKPLTAREIKNAEEIEESDTYDQNTIHQS